MSAPTQKLRPETAACLRVSNTGWKRGKSFLLADSAIKEGNETLKALGKGELVLVPAAELEALKQDKARMDWIENPASCYFVTIQRQPDGHHVRNGNGPGTRQSIDRAINNPVKA